MGAGAGAGVGRRTMPIVGRRMLVVAVLTALLAAGVARADNNPNGMVFRAVVNPVNSTVDQSGSGRPNVTFIQMLPFVSPQMINCLRAQYAPLSTDLFTSLSLVIRATVVGVSDTGDTFRANPIRYTLNLRHTCGNGRIDDGEQCDPHAPSTCLGHCLIPQGATNGLCSNNKNHFCLVDTDCQGICLPPNDPSECICVY